jgi:response regulator RpfG family c-di-GMP phosphodiesterase
MPGALDFAHRATILVVDDTPDNLSLMSELLKDTYRIKAVNNGERALKSVQGDRPDLTLLDIMRPGLSGYDVIRELKAAPASRHIPVIFLMAMSAAEDETKGWSAYYHQEKWDGSGYPTRAAGDAGAGAGRTRRRDMTGGVPCRAPVRGIIVHRQPGGPLPAA